MFFYKYSRSLFFVRSCGAFYRELRLRPTKNNQKTSNKKKRTGVLIKKHKIRFSPKYTKIKKKITQNFEKIRQNSLKNVENDNKINTIKSKQSWKHKIFEKNHKTHTIKYINS